MSKTVADLLYISSPSHAPYHRQTSRRPAFPVTARRTSHLHSTTPPIVDPRLPITRWYFHNPAIIRHISAQTKIWLFCLFVTFSWDVNPTIFLPRTQNTTSPFIQRRQQQTPPRHRISLRRTEPVLDVNTSSSSSLLHWITKFTRSLQRFTGKLLLSVLFYFMNRYIGTRCCREVTQKKQKKQKTAASTVSYT